MNPHATRSASQTPEVRLASISDRLVTLGATYDAEPDFPIECLKLLAAADLHRTFAPYEAGGEAFEDPGRRLFSMFNLLRQVGRCDLSLGRIYEGHLNALELFGWFGTSAQRRQLGENLSRGLWYGCWATEPPPGVRLVSDAQGARLVGEKVFATGAGGLDFAVVTAQPAEGQRRLVIAPANLADRADLSAWQVRGMRATGSGRYDLTGLPVAQQDLLGAPGAYDQEPRFTTGAWRFTAVQLGGVEALVVETRRAMGQAARDDPLQRAKFAEAVAAARTAYLWVREAAQRAAADDVDGPAFARMTRGVVERAALDVMELSARIVGTRSAFDGQRIDHISRDLSLYLRQAGPDYARDQAAIAWLDHDAWGTEDVLW